MIFPAAGMMNKVLTFNICRVKYKRSYGAGKWMNHRDGSGDPFLIENSNFLAACS